MLFGQFEENGRRQVIDVWRSVSQYRPLLFVLERGKTGEASTAQRVV